MSSAQPTPEQKPGVGTALPIAVCVITLARTMPSILDAWRSDLYARGAWIAFIIWVGIQAYARFTSPRRHEQETAWWLAAALAAGCLGALSTMRVYDSISLCFAITGLFSVGWTSAICIVAAATWFQATGWFISPFWKGGLTGWERPLAAVVFSALFLIVNRWRRDHPPVSSPTLP